MQHRHPQTRFHAAYSNYHQAPYTREAMYSQLIDRLALQAALSGSAK